jgi:hypothetical protein
MTMFYEVQIQSRPALHAGRTLIAALVMSLAAAALAQGSGSVIYPAKGQSAEQQSKDRFECYEWAKAQTGFDPTQASAVVAAYQPAPTGQTSSGRSTATGMATGAMGGAAVTELTKGDAGKGAAYGALGSVVLGQVKQQKAEQANQASQQQMAQQMSHQAAARGQQRANYERHIGACMEGRGYTVK